MTNRSLRVLESLNEFDAYRLKDSKKRYRVNRTEVERRDFFPHILLSL
jgi:hypothetical protein